MMIKNTTITKGFIAAGFMNASVLIFSRFFTNKTINEYDPSAMSNFGLIMIFIWGLAYTSVAKKYCEVKWLIGLFALEKLIYGCIWVHWLLNNTISEVYEKDIMAAIFYAMYGVNDWIFFIFFLVVFFQLLKSKNNEYRRAAKNP